MRLTQLEYILAIKKYGSITKAAEHLFLAQPSMSAAVRELEDELGYGILKRTKKGSTFTLEGEELVLRAEQIFALVEEIRGLYDTGSEQYSGRIFVSTVPFVQDRFLLQLLIQLKEQHPALRIIVDETDMKSILGHVIKQETDLGIILVGNNEKDRYLTEMEQRNISYQVLASGEMAFFVGKENPLYGVERAPLAELLQYPYVYYRGGYTEEDRAFFETHAQGNLPEGISLQDKESVKKYVAQSMGVTACPLQLMEDNLYVQTGLLHPVRIAELNWNYEIAMIRRADVPLRREEGFFLKCIKEIVS